MAVAMKMAVAVVLALRPGPVNGLPGVEAQATPLLMPSLVFDAAAVYMWPHVQRQLPR